MSIFSTLEVNNFTSSGPIKAPLGAFFPEKSALQAYGGLGQI